MGRCREFQELDLSPTNCARWGERLGREAARTGPRNFDRDVVAAIRETMRRVESGCATDHIKAASTPNGSTSGVPRKMQLEVATRQPRKIARLMRTDYASANRGVCEARHMARANMRCHSESGIALPFPLRHGATPGGASFRTRHHRRTARNVKTSWAKFPPLRSTSESTLRTS